MNAARHIRQPAEEAASTFPPLLADAQHLAQTVAAGLHGRRRAGPGESFWQHRPYAFGDSVSMIDWRQSARATDRLYVRQNEWEAAAAIWIWRDMSASLDYAFDKQTPTKARRADILATALTILLSQAGERIGLIPNNTSQRRRPFQGRNAPWRFLDALLSEESAGDSNEAHLPVIEAGAGATIVLMSDFFVDPAEQQEVISAYAAQGVAGILVQIIDPSEEDFPFEGRVEFLDVESRDSLTFGSAAAKRAQYRQRFAAHQSALAAQCQAIGWRFITHRTDAPATQALLSLYQNIAADRGHA